MRQGGNSFSTNCADDPEEEEEVAIKSETGMVDQTLVMTEDP